jgi:type VI secretion system IcmF/VasK family protein
MFFQILKRTIIPFGLPLVLVLLVFFLARRRLEFLKRLPLWLWVTIVLAIIAIWIFVIVWNWWSQRQRAKAIEAGIMKQAQWNAENAAPGRRAEVEEIRKSLGEAITMLRKGPEGKKALYSLPWYMIIGPPAIGKTTAIVNSGLNFPGMTTARRMRGAGGTRNCDWWFSTDAILLDTAGRYAQSADRSETEPEWFAFLDLLRKHRGRGPINGLLLGYSMETLVEADESRIISDARELRERMDEVLDRLGWTFPVYVVFTKCDLVGGFADFFSSLSPVERQQVWGATYPIVPSHEQNAAERFVREFDQLMHRLRELRIRRMAALSGGDAWGRTFMFPEEFSALRGKLHVFIETLFEPNPFKKDAPLFRGTYFTSGKQVGKPFDLIVKKIQAMLGNAAAPAGPPTQPEKEDAYFVRDLFTKVLKGDRDILRRTHAAGARFARLQFAGSAVFMALSLLACLWIGVSCSRLGSKMDTTKAMAVNVTRSSGGALDVKTLDELDRLRRSIRGSWRAFPLNVAYSVRDTALMVYLDAARKRVLIPVEEEIATDLDRPSRLDGDQVRRALRAELMLLDPAKADDIGEAADLASVVAQYGFPNLDPAGPEMKQIEGIVEEFLEKKTPLLSLASRQTELEAGARRLDDTHVREEYFEGIVSAASRCAPDLTLRSLAGDQTILIVPDEAVVRAAFSKTGFITCVSEAFRNVNKTMQADIELIERAGVKPRNEAPSEKELMALYVDAYPEEWQTFLSAVHLRSYTGCADAVVDLKELRKKKSSPLMKLIDGASTEARLESKDLQGKLVGSELVDAINNEMRPLLEFTAAGKDEDAPSDEYAAQLVAVYEQIAACAEDPTVGFDGKVLLKAETWADDYADRFGNSLGYALGRLLKQPLNMTKSAVSSQGTLVAAGDWQANIVTFFSERLGAKYPFNRESEDMASADDVIGFFGPDGKLDQFARSLADAGKQPTPELQQCLDAANDIRGWLRMTSGSLKSSFTFEAAEVKPIAGSSEGEAYNRRIDQTVLTINGVALADQRAGASKTFTWSSDDEAPDCSLVLNYTQGNQKIAALEFSSLWAICQLFDEASARREGGGHRLVWRFAEQGIEVHYLLTMKSGNECPFLKDSAFRNFDKLFPAQVVN